MPARILIGVLVVVAVGCGGRERVATVEPKPVAPSELFLAGDGELWTIDVETEQVRHRVVKELAAGDATHRIVRRGRRMVLFGYSTYTLGDADAPVSKLADGTWFFIPSATEDRVWLAYLEPDQPRTSVRLSAIREVTVEGEVTVPDVRPPGGEWPVSAVRGGIVYEDEQGLVVWDPVARAEVRRVSGGFVGPGHGDLLVTADPDECGELVLTDVSTGRERRVAPITPRGCWGIHDAAFSPDGTRLAVSFTRRPRYEVSHELALVDVRTAAATPVAGSKVPYGYVLIDWSAAGDQVFITGGQRFKKRTIVAYRVGEPAARRLQVDTGDFYDMAAR